MKITMEGGDEGVIVLDSEEETARLAAALASLATPGTVVGLVGPLGAGKTLFSRAFAAALGVDPEAVTSPTFVLIHEYEGRLPVYHFDAYRLPDADAFEALGVADYWDAGGVCLVEWADRVAGLLPDRTWWVRLAPVGEHSRRAGIRGVDATAVAGRLSRRGATFDPPHEGS